jgi:hypothetical protein
MAEFGDKARTPFKGPRGDATADEKIAAFETFMANAGTYEITGDTVAFNAVMAKVPNATTGTRPRTKSRFRIEGGRLTLTNTADETVP